MHTHRHVQSRSYSQSHKVAVMCAVTHIRNPVHSQPCTDTDMCSHSYGHSHAQSQGVTVMCATTHSHNHEHSQPWIVTVMCSHTLVQSQSSAVTVTYSRSHVQSRVITVMRAVTHNPIMRTRSHGQSQTVTVTVMCSHTHVQSQSSAVSVTRSHSCRQSVQWAQLQQQRTSCEVCTSFNSNQNCDFFQYFPAFFLVLMYLYFFPMPYGCVCFRGHLYVYGSSTSSQLVDSYFTNCLFIRTNQHLVSFRIDNLHLPTQFQWAV